MPHKKRKAPIGVFFVLFIIIEAFCYLVSGICNIPGVTILITSRFTSAFIILLKSGMNITDCMENLVRILNNEVFTEKFRYSIEEVKRGKRIAKSIENTNIFPWLDR